MCIADLPYNRSEPTQWRPTTEIDVADIDDEICSHALIDRSNGSRVRVISFTTQWPAAAVRRSHARRTSATGPDFSLSRTRLRGRALIKLKFDCRE
jgi:hypothetical protein